MAAGTRPQFLLIKTAMGYSSQEIAIVFDFGGVLVDWDPRHLYRKVFLGNEMQMERFLEEIHFYEWNQKQDAGRTFSKAVADLCRQYPQYCDLIRLYDLRYEESITGPILPTIEIVVKLKKFGYSLYGLSNWPQEKYRLIRSKYSFFDLFDLIIISGEVKVAKPDPRIYTIFLERIGKQASWCVYIDDSKKNIETAQELGFKCIHYQSPGQLIESLGELGIDVSPGASTYVVE